MEFDQTIVGLSVKVANNIPKRSQPNGTMYGVITVNVKDTLLISVPPQKYSEQNVYYVEGIMHSKSVGTLSNKNLLIKSILINLVLGNKNEMD